MPHHNLIKFWVRFFHQFLAVLQINFFRGTLRSLFFAFILVISSLGFQQNVTPVSAAALPVTTTAGTGTGSLRQVVAHAAVVDGESKYTDRFRLRSTNSHGSDGKAFSIAAMNPNDAPTNISLSNNSITENQPAGSTIGFLTTTDPDSSTFDYSLANGISGCDGSDNASFFISGNQLLSAYSFNYESHSGSYSICIRTTDNGIPKATLDKHFTINVTDVNEAPTAIGFTPNDLYEEQSAGVNAGSLSTTDPDQGDTFTYTLVSDSGADDNTSFSIDHTNIVTVVPLDYEKKSNYNVRIRSTDSGGLYFEQPFTISIINVNEDPLINQVIADKTVVAGDHFSFAFPASTFTDPDSDTLTYSALLKSGGPLPAWLNFDPSNRQFSGKANKVQAISVQVTADDGKGGHVSTNFQITVTAQVGNHNPVVIKPIPNASSNVGQPFSDTVPADTFGDYDHDSLTYLASLSDDSPLPAWLSFNPVSGTFSGTPAPGDAGILTLKVTALDGNGGEGSTTFDLGVNKVGVSANVAPSLNAPIPNQSGQRGVLWTFQFAANTFVDADNDPLTYTASLSNGSPLPAWLTFDSATHTFSGIPPQSAQSNYFYSLRVTASDGISSHQVSDTFQFGPWLLNNSSGNLPSGSSSTFVDSIGEGPADIPGNTTRLFYTIDLQLSYAGQPISELGGNGVKVCFDVSPEDSLKIGGNLSRLVIATSHNSGPWTILNTFIGDNSFQICAYSTQFSLFDVFLKSNPASTSKSSASSASSLPETGFVPGKTTLLPAQPLEKRYTSGGDVWLEIPSQNIKAPVVGVPFDAGKWDVTWLGNNIGWLQGTAFPGMDGNSVLSGHVVDANGKDGVFYKLSDLKWGDTIILHAFNQVYTYEIRTVDLWVNPRNAAIKHETLPWLTLVTCHGYNPQDETYQWRTVIRAVLIKTEMQ
jgi:LPXTG-site transpeptidase (sortase) family protein